MKSKFCFFLVILSLLSINSCVDDPRVVNCSDAINGWNVSSFEFLEDQKPVDICFPVIQVGYMVGDFGSVTKTEDGGESWKLIHSGDLGNRVTTCDLRTVSF